MSTSITSQPKFKTLIEYEGGSVGSVVKTTGFVTTIEHVSDGQILKAFSKTNFEFISQRNTQSSISTEVKSITTITFIPGNVTRIEPAIMGIAGKDGEQGPPGQDGTGSSTTVCEEIVVTPIQLMSKSITLREMPKAPECLDLFIYGGIKQRPNHDFALTGKVISWNALALEYLLEVGSVISLRYDI